MTKGNSVNQLGVVLLEDWLIKSPPCTKIKNIKSWHRRYFALLEINRNEHIVPKNWSKKGAKSLEDLHDVYLVYWESKHDRKKGIKPIRTIPLFKGYSVDIQPTSYFKEKFQHLLALNTIERKYYLCAESEEKKQIWVDLLTRCIESVQVKESHLMGKEPIYESILELLNSAKGLTSSWSSSNCSSDLNSSQGSSSNIKGLFDRRSSCASSTTTDSSSVVYESLEDLDLTNEFIKEKRDCSRTKSLEHEKKIIQRRRPGRSQSLQVDDIRCRSIKNNLRSVVPRFKTTLNLDERNFDDISNDIKTEHDLQPIYFELDKTERSTIINKDFKNENVTQNSDSIDSNSSSLSDEISPALQVISFNDIKLQVPTDSTINISDGCVRVKTTRYEYVMTVKYDDTEHSDEHDDGSNEHDDVIAKTLFLLQKGCP